MTHVKEIHLPASTSPSRAASCWWDTLPREDGAKFFWIVCNDGEKVCLSEEAARIIASVIRKGK